MKKALAGLLVGLVLATAGIAYSQGNRSDLFNIVMRPFNPFVKYVGTLYFQNAAGTNVASIDQNGAVTGRESVLIVSSGNRDSILTTESNKLFISTATSGTQRFILPAASNPGLRYCFSAGMPDTEILVQVQSADNVIGKIHAANDGTVIQTAAGTGIKNTAGTNVTGDFTCLVSDGGVSWYMQSLAGVWASQ